MRQNWCQKVDLNVQIWTFEAVFGPKGGLFGTKRWSFWTKGGLFGPKGGLFGTKGGLFGPKGGLFGTKGGLFGPKGSNFPDLIVKKEPFLENFRRNILNKSIKNCLIDLLI